MRVNEKHRGSCFPLSFVRRRKGSFARRLLFPALLLLAAMAVQASSPAGFHPRHARSIDSLLSLTYSYAERNHLYIGTYVGVTYSKFHLHTDIHNLAFRLLPHSIHLPRGKHHYFGESIAKTEYTDLGGAMSRKELAFHSTMPRMRSLRNLYMQGINMQLYKPYLVTDRSLSPFYKTGKRYYAYHADSSFVDSKGRRAVVVSIRPRYQNPSLIRGSAVILEATGRVDSMTYEATYDGLLHLHVEAKFNDSDDEMGMLPVRAYFTAKYHFGGNRMSISVFASSLTGKVSTTPVRQALRDREGQHKYDVSRLGILEADTFSTIRSPRYFDTTRPMPLTAEELGMMQAAAQADSARREQRKLERESAAEDFFLDDHKFSLLGSRATVALPPLLSLSMIQWSGKRGLSVQKRIKTTITMPWRGGILWSGPRIGYSLKQKQLYWQVPISISLLQRIGGAIEIKTGNGNRIYSSLQAREVRENLRRASGYDSLISVLDNYNFNYYNDFYTRALFKAEPTPGLSLKAGAVYHKRTLRGWKHIAAESGMQRRRESLAPRVDVSYTPATYYYAPSRNAPRRSLGSRAPTFRASYERGMKWGHRMDRYEKTEIDCSYHIDAGMARQIYLRGAGGLFTNKADTYFVDFDNFSFHDMPVGWDDDMMGEFHLLDRRFYNESDYYAMVTAMYEAPMLLLGKMKPVSRVVSTERLYLGSVFLDALNPYTELGYGVATPLLDGALFVGASRFSHFLVGGKISFRFFDRW